MLSCLFVAQDADAIAVRHMSAAPDALSMNNDDQEPFLVVIYLPKEENCQTIPGVTDSDQLESTRKRHDTIVAQIRSALSCDLPVVIAPWKCDGGAVNFDKTSIRALCGSLNRTVEWQGMWHSDRSANMLIVV